MSRFAKRRQVGLALASIVVGVGVLGGCSAAEPGNASPSPDVAAPSDPFAGLQSCEALDEAISGQGFPPAVKETAGGGNGCKSNKPQFGFVGLVLDDRFGIDQLNFDSSKIHQGDVNGRAARLVREGIGTEGGCAIALEVTSTSRAYVNVALRKSTDEACQFVQTVAEGIEPQLPKAK